MYQRISPQQAKEFIDQQDAQIVDIRDPESFQRGHIPAAVLLDNNNLAQFIAEADITKPLIVCCYHGNSSQSAANYLHEQGFEQSYSLDGGFEQWRMLFPENIDQ